MINDTENDHLIILPSRHMCPSYRNWISISGKRTTKFLILIRLFVSLILLSNWNYYRSIKPGYITKNWCIVGRTGERAVLREP